MEDFFAEIEYIQKHFPELAMQYIPGILIFVTIVQVILLLIHHSRKSDGTETGQKSGDALMGIIVTGWLLLAILVGFYAFFYYKENIAV